MPLWAIASTSVGGLALDNHWLGLLLSSSAAFGLVYSTLVFYMLLASLAGLLEGMDWVVSVVGSYTLGLCLHLLR